VASGCALLQRLAISRRIRPGKGSVWRSNGTPDFPTLPRLLRQRKPIVDAPTVAAGEKTRWAGPTTNRSMRRTLRVSAKTPRLKSLSK